MNQQGKVENKESLNSLLSVLKEAQCPKQLRVRKTTSYVLEYNQNEVTYREQRNLVPSRKLRTEDSDFIKVYEEKKAEALKVKEDNAVKNFALASGYSKGDKVKPITGLERLTLQENEAPADTDYVYSPGEVVLLDFWATWCGPCQGPMAHNEEMLKKNEESWKNKVRIVGISLDDEREKLVKRIEDKDWRRITHYRVKNGWDDKNEAMQLFEIEGIPFVCLLDKNGRIVYSGHPSEIKLEEEINRLVNEQQQEGQGQEEQEQYSTASQDQVDNFKKNRNFLRNQMKNWLQTNKADGSFNLTLVKSYEVGVDGQKVNTKKENLKLNYRIKVENKEFVDQALALIKGNTTEVYLTVDSAKLDDPNSDRKNHLKFIQQTLKENELNVELGLVTTTIIKYDMNKKLFSSTEETEIKQTNSLPPSEAAKAKQVKEPLVDYYRKNRENNMEEFDKFFRNGIESSLSVGSNYCTVSNVHRFGNQEEILTVEHKQGQVLVLDIWAFWCGPCISGMKKNSTILKENKEIWGDQVRFVALSLEGEDDTSELLKKNTEWTEQIEFFFFKDGRENPAPDTYGVKFIPHYVVVDKFGVIRNLASVENIKGVIDNLLGEQQQGAQQVEQKVQSISNEQRDGIIQTFNKECLAKLNEQVAQIPQPFFQFNIRVPTVYTLDLETGEKQPLKNSKPIVRLWYRDNQAAFINELKNRIFAVVPQEQLEFTEEVSKTVDIPFPGQQCAVCKAALNDQTPQYYSHFTKEFVCVACAEADDKEKVGLERYKFTDTLVFINAPLNDLSVLKSLDEYKLGKNLKIAQGEAGSQQHPMSCNGCGAGTEGPRYIAINCRPGPYRGDGYVDVCQNCFMQLKTKTSEKCKEILEGQKHEGLTTDAVYLRVLFSHGYKDY